MNTTSITISIEFIIIALISIISGIIILHEVSKGKLERWITPWMVDIIVGIYIVSTLSGLGIMISLFIIGIIGVIG